MPGEDGDQQQRSQAGQGGPPGKASGSRWSRTSGGHPRPAADRWAPTAASCGPDHGLAVQGHAGAVQRPQRDVEWSPGRRRRSGPAARWWRNPPGRRPARWPGRSGRSRCPTTSTASTSSPAQPVGQPGRRLAVPLEARSTPPRARPCGRPPRPGRSRSGWNSTPPVPTTQCAGQDSTKSGWVAEVRARVDVVVLGGDHVVPPGRPAAIARRSPAATAAPPATASEPPSQKSFCTSTMISALAIGVSLSGGVDGRAQPAGTTVTGTAGSPAESFSPSHGMEIRHRRRCSRACAETVAQVVHRLAAAASASSCSSRSSACQLGHALGDDDLLGGGAGRLVPADRGLAAADRSPCARSA